MDLDSFTWYNAIIYDDKPVARYGHCTGIYDNKLICFGGMGNNHFIGSDIFVINMDFGENKDTKDNLQFKSNTNIEKANSLQRASIKLPNF